MPATKDIADFWLWPWKAVQANVALAETLMSVPPVIAARLPMIATAMRDPLKADTKELTQMVTEKAEAFGRSHQSISAAARKIRAASDANARDLGRLMGGSLFGPADMIRMTERSLSAWAAFATLPAQALAPVHKRVSSNARRLRK